MKYQVADTFQNIEAAYTGDLSFWELMILGKLYALVKSVDADFCTYTLRLADFVPNSTEFHNSIAESASRLLERKIKWTDENEHICQTNLLTSIEIATKTDETSLFLTIHPKLKTALTDFKLTAKPDEFLHLPILRISSGLRLYTILLQNITRPYYSFTIELEKLKGLLDVADKYTLYSNFKIKILEEAQKRILNETQTHFDFSEIKTGKKVTAIRFRMEAQPLLSLFENNQEEHLHSTPIPQPKPEIVEISSPENTPQTPINQELIQKISEKIGVSLKMMKKLSEDFSESTLRQALILTEKTIEKGGIKGSAAGFFVEAVRQNYQISEQDEKEKKQAEARQKAGALAQIEAEKRQERENLKKQEFEQERDAILDELTIDTVLQHTITERIRYSIFHASFEVSKSFDDNLENPSFLAAVLNFYKIVKKR